MQRIQSLVQVIKGDENMREDTTIRLKRTTRERFNSIGVRGETDDELLNRLLDELEKARK